MFTEEMKRLADKEFSLEQMQENVIKAFEKSILTTEITNKLNSLLDSINRVEVIDGDVRSYVNMKSNKVSISIQDEGETLKIFIS